MLKILNKDKDEIGVGCQAHAGRTYLMRLASAVAAFGSKVLGIIVDRVVLAEVFGSELDSTEDLSHGSFEQNAESGCWGGQAGCDLQWSQIVKCALVNGVGDFQLAVGGQLQEVAVSNPIPNEVVVGGLVGVSIAVHDPTAALILKFVEN